MTDISAGNNSEGVLARQHSDAGRNLLDALPRAEIAVFLLIVFAATAFNVPLHMVSPLLVMAVQVVVGTAVMVRIPGYAPAIVIFLFLFQNVFVSLFSPMVKDVAELNFVRGYNFLAAVTMWLIAFAQYFFRGGFPAPVMRLMMLSTGTLAIISFYFLYGLSQTGMSAAIYLRNIALPIFMFQLCLLTSVRSTVRLTPLFVAMTVLLMICGYVELLFRETWFEITNSSTYWMFGVREQFNAGQFDKLMRETGQVFLSFRDVFRSTLFNTSLLGDNPIEVMRLNGPNMSVIPFAYALAFLFLFLTAVGRWPMALLLLPLLLFASAKGPVILILLVLGALAATRLVGAVATLAGFALALFAYGFIGIKTGVAAGDYHAIGFMGGLNGFFSNPFGRGLGVGGNLSEGFANIDWNRAQAQGATDAAYESSVGVLLYQMGFGSAAPLALYVWIGLSCWTLYARSLISAQGVAAFGMFVIVFNGLFQEEALFSPTALGLIVSFAGLVLGSQYRARAALVHRA